MRQRLSKHILCGSQKLQHYRQRVIANDEVSTEKMKEMSSRLTEGQFKVCEDWVASQNLSLSGENLKASWTTYTSPNWDGKKPETWVASILKKANHTLVRHPYRTIGTYIVPVTAAAAVAAAAGCCYLAYLIAREVIPVSWACYERGNKKLIDAINAQTSQVVAPGSNTDRKTGSNTDRKTGSNTDTRSRTRSKSRSSNFRGTKAC